ncbi:uncharacterized protein N7482_003707 [Penicillium canariense]|uniref:CCHC-type domain-containing protein n=1 Tax=Penicillium canariense TaxID=189055 RepID=A0A9W9LPV4_9EURO|nr:uncharacterized protein N7482_003707 [Penicillium canariense]KAJ5168113.1 hypothetical protein N7482_003707 [Penicillium canariense]
MSDPGDDADSRTASFGVQRARRTTPSRTRPDSDSHPTKKRRRNRSRKDSDVSDFVPKGAAFSANLLAVDPDDTSSSGSDSDSDNDSDKSDVQGKPAPAPANPHAGSTAPAISWNQGTKAAVRTSLGKRKAEPQAQPQPQPQPQTNGHTANGTSAKQFKAVNGAYWRSRSASVSSEASKADSVKDSEVNTNSEEGEVNSGSDSDDSELDSEADDSLMLNIGTKGDGTDDYDPESLLLENSLSNGHANGKPNGSTAAPLPGSEPVQTESKEEAFKRFSEKYPTAPVSLLDLKQDDMDVQAKLVYWDRDVNAIDLQLPVGCTECLRQGHMAEVCPTKECIHCGAWDTHQSTQCPSWRRCQRCRERGHVEDNCPSPLKSSAAEVPCDLCGASTHMESDCDLQYNLPMREPLSQNIVVSISCAHCTSGKHLIGDCPHLPPDLQQKTASFTLKDIDPANITNLNDPVRSRKGPPPPTSYQRGKGRPRGPRTPPSNSEDDMMPRKGGRKPPPPARGRGRGTIKFGSSVVADKPRGRPPSGPRPKGPPPRGGGGGGGGRGRGRGRGGKPRGGRP